MLIRNGFIRALFFVISVLLKVFELRNLKLSLFSLEPLYYNLLRK